MREGFGYTKNYLLKGEEPWFPVMGEFHYSRYREKFWEESLRKIKAGGISIVSSYVIWIHHEEEEGVFDFSDCRDLGKFIGLCKKVGLFVFLRLGPWVHGEVRNGGFPDWLQAQEKEIELRSDDERYLHYVRRFWEQVFEQVKGQMYDDGGPVIGIQIENEYGHVGGFWGEKGETHMRTLQNMAKEIGFQVPFYTATGWGGAVIGDCIPVMGGYCEAPWDQSIGELPASPNYVFSHIRSDNLIGRDELDTENMVTFDESRFPFLMAELGGGLQVTEHRRPVPTGEDIGAMSITKLGCGVSLLGYYMYHGGSNPKGKFSPLHESKLTGSCNNLPEINYDFNAPIRQYGTISDSYKEIKAIAYFLDEWGKDFAVLQTDILHERTKPEDTHTLRMADRHDDTHGYILFNNYQRRRNMDEQKQVVICNKGGQNVAFPAIDIPSGVYGFFPYHMKLDDAMLAYATATPLCCIRGKEDKTYIFYGDFEPKYVWEEEKAANVIHLSRKDAMNAWKVHLDRDYLILSENYIWEEDGRLSVVGDENTIIKCYPRIEQIPGFAVIGEENGFTVYKRKMIPKKETAYVSYQMTTKEEDRVVYDIDIHYSDKMNCEMKWDAILWLEYAGYRMNIYVGEEKINDHFYTGQQVPVSLKYFDFPTKIKVEIFSLEKDSQVFMEKWPKLMDGKACRLEKVFIKEEMR